jgi:hypothetical protein
LVASGAAEHVIAMTKSRIAKRRIATHERERKHDRSIRQSSRRVKSFEIHFLDERI